MSIIIFFSNFVKSLQIHYISAQFLIFLIGTSCLNTSISKNENLVRDSQTIKAKFS